MGIYFNKSRRALPCTMRDGSTWTFPRKQKTEVPPELEGSPALMRLVNKGMVIRLEDPPPAPVTPAKPKVSKAASKQKPVVKKAAKAKKAQKKEEVSDSSAPKLSAKDVTVTVRDEKAPATASLDELTLEDKGAEESAQAAEKSTSKNTSKKKSSKRVSKKVSKSSKSSKVNKANKDVDSSSTAPAEEKSLNG
jgi:hypothetical protein